MSAELTPDDSIEIQRALELSCPCPTDAQLLRWAQAAIIHGSATGMTVRIVDPDEIKSSNLQWRGKDKPTNVLSFPADFPPQAGINYLGDIMICAAVVRRESEEQGKLSDDHWAHIVVHGVLHLQGFDHENEQDAQQMEQREREILATLGVSDPYQEDIDFVDNVLPAGASGRDYDR